MKVVCLSGGVGGAKLARGLYDVLGSGDSRSWATSATTSRCSGSTSRPISTPCSTRSPASTTRSAAGVARARPGARSSRRGSWGGDAWFQLGDLDIGLHLVRTQRSRAGEPLSSVSAALAGQPGSTHSLLPATDDRAPHARRHARRGRSHSRTGSSHGGTRTRSTRASSTGADPATPAPGVVEAIREADALVFAPSNPYVSIDPILAVAAIRGAVAARRVRCRRRQPADRWPRGQRPARPYAQPHGGRHDSPAHVAGCYPGLIDALVIDRRRRARRGRLPLVATETLMEDRDAAAGWPRPCSRPSREGRRRRRHGSFGTALARRLAEADYEVVIGSRDAERAAAAAAELGVAGATNADACRAADLVDPRDQGRGRSRHRRGASRRDRRDARPLGRGGAELRAGRRPADDRRRRRSPRASRTSSTARSSRGSTRSRRATSAGTSRPRRTRSSAATTPTRRSSSLELAARITSGRAIDCGPLALRPRARGPHRGDRQRQQALQGARGRPPHGRPLSRGGRRRHGQRHSARGHPRARRGRRSRPAAPPQPALRAGSQDGDVVVVAQKAVSKVEGRVVGSPTSSRPRARVELAGPRRRPAPPRGDPPREP